MAKFEFGLAKECLYKAKDFGGLLLLASSAGDAVMMERLAEEALKSGDTNIAFTCHLMCGHVEKCLDILLSSERLPEAAFFARTYLPSQITRYDLFCSESRESCVREMCLFRVVELWKEQLAQSNQKMADRLADPDSYENLFSDFKLSLSAEQVSCYKYSLNNF